MYAIIEDSGTQFKVTTGDHILIDRSVDDETKTVTFDRILLVGGGEAGVRVGAPILSGVTVTADVINADFKSPKVMTAKYKRRKRYSIRKGHRQQYTRVAITGIVG